jgi:hypothetical protein
MKPTATLTALRPTSARTFSAAMALLALAITSLPAQQARPATASPAGPGTAEQTIVLSPIEESSERDTGFVAASALAGGRLASELRDTPVAYSEITREFNEALNLTD